MSKILIKKCAIMLAICICLAVLIFLIAKPKGKVVDGIEIVETKKEESEKITKQEAVNITIEQFKRLGENVESQDLKVDILERDGESYYYIKSPQNSIQIQINTGKIVRINSVSI